MALTPQDIQDLSKTIQSAFQQATVRNSGGKWDPISNSAKNREKDPQERAERMRYYKNQNDANKLTRELIQLQGRQVKNFDELKKVVDYNTSTFSKLANNFHSMEQAEREIIRALNRQMQDKSVSDAVKTLAGSINTLEDALKFGDVAENTGTLARLLTEQKAGKYNLMETNHTLKEIKAVLRANGNKKLSDFPELAALSELDKRIERLIAHSTDPNSAIYKRSKRYVDTHRPQMNQNGQPFTQEEIEAMYVERSKGEAERVAARLLKKQGSAFQKGMTNAEQLAQETNVTGLKANIETMKKHTSVTSLATNKLAEWGLKVGSTAFVLGKLAEAASRLYGQMKSSAGTGTERTLWGVLRRDFQSGIINGIDPTVMQQIQVDNATTRSAMGRGAFDKNVYDMSGQFFNQTGNRQDSAKMVASTMQTLTRSGVGADAAVSTTKKMVEAFEHLQYLTGMTAEQFAAMNQELMSDRDVRQSLINLTEKERALALKNLSLTIADNAQRGISIEQSKAQLKAQLDMANPNSPKARLKNSVRMRALGGALGMNLNDASEMTYNGGPAGYKKFLMNTRGMSEAQADAQVKLASGQLESAGSKISSNLGRNDATGFMTEALGVKMDSLKPMFDGTFAQQLNEASKLQGEAAREFHEGVKKFVGATPGMQALDHVKNALTTVTSSIVTGLAGFLLLGRAFTSGANTLGKFGVGGILKNPLTAGKEFLGGIVGMSPKAVGPLQAAAGAATASGATPAAVASGGKGAFARYFPGAMGVGLTAIQAGSIMFDGSLNSGQKVEGVSGAVGSGLGAWGGASAGAALGSLAGPIGTVVGGVIGSLVGGWAGAGAGSDVGRVINGITGVGSPKPPSASTPTVNTPASNTSSAAQTGSVVSPTNANGSPVTQVDQNALLKNSIDLMNTTLASILKEIQTQNMEIASSSEKSVAMQQKLARAFKQNGFVATPLGGANAFNG